MKGGKFSFHRHDAGRTDRALAFILRAVPSCLPCIAGALELDQARHLANRDKSRGQSNKQCSSIAPLLQTTTNLLVSVLLFEIEPFFVITVTVRLLCAVAPRAHWRAGYLRDGACGIYRGDAENAVFRRAPLRD